MTASVVFAVILSGLWTGALARLAIPGPDPMPIWLTLAIGLAGSIVGAVVGKSISNDNGVVISFLSFGFAMALVAAYRRFVQMYSTVVMGMSKEDLEHRLRALLAHARVARVHQGVHAAGHEAVVDEEVLFDAELRVAAFEVAGAVVLDAMAQYQILSASRRADRIGLHEA